MNRDNGAPALDPVSPYPRIDSLLAGTYVVDASIGVKWFVKEEDSVLARRLLRQAAGDVRRLVAPGLFWHEVANVLRYSSDAEEQLHRNLEILAQCPVRSIEVSPTDLPFVAMLARRLDLTVYDATYVAVSIRHGIPLVTEDRKVAAACAKSVPVFDLRQLLGNTLMEMMAPYVAMSREENPDTRRSPEVSGNQVAAPDGWDSVAEIRRWRDGR